MMMVAVAATRDFRTVNSLRISAPFFEIAKEAAN